MKTTLVYLAVFILVTGEASCQYLTYIDEDFAHLYAQKAQLVRYFMNQLRAIRMYQLKQRQQQQSPQQQQQQKQKQQQPPKKSGSPVRPLFNRQRALLSLWNSYLRRPRITYDFDLDLF